jgi:hypothetical protein
MRYNDKREKLIKRSVSLYDNNQLNHKTMEFRIMTLGKGLKKLENGFGEEGDWNIYKCFYGDYAEFYINFNEKEGIGEIKRKDITYAPILEDAFDREMNDLNKIRAEEAKVEEIEQEEKGAHCVKCGEPISGDEDSLCQYCI